jgi:hypothetical protein
MKGGDDMRAPQARKPQALLGEALGESGAGGGPYRGSPGESFAAQGRLRIGVGRGQGRRADPK